MAYHLGQEAREGFMNLQYQENFKMWYLIINHQPLYQSFWDEMGEAVEELGKLCHVFVTNEDKTENGDDCKDMFNNNIAMAD